MSRDIDDLANLLPWDHLRAFVGDQSCYPCLVSHISNTHATPNDAWADPESLRKAFPELGDLHILHIGITGSALMSQLGW